MSIGMPDEEDDSDYNSKIIESLRTSLNAAESRNKELEGLNTVLRSSKEEESMKYIRLTKKYKLLSQQVRRRYSGENSGPSSPNTSRKGSTLDLQEAGSNINQRKKSVDGDSEEVKEKAEYIKNILLGYLEHKEQRPILQPVVKALLYLSDQDEKKFINLLSKQ
ncbi:unnamed protein product [Ambrosiozyma monospora]|uniref:Unnamed protein product n=1 Tax=Ambrosiozyma monospora TaxID=43982 RepID=A0ACB5SYK5_AMBMO|nr:unnamed protein product [Ambrosiozyma monospora]